MYSENLLTCIDWSFSSPLSWHLNLGETCGTEVQVKVHTNNLFICLQKCTTCTQYHNRENWYWTSQKIFTIPIFEIYVDMTIQDNNMRVLYRFLFYRKSIYTPGDPPLPPTHTRVSLLKYNFYISVYAPIRT